MMLLGVLLGSIFLLNKPAPDPPRTLAGAVRSGGATTATVASADSCSAATPISGSGPFSFDNTNADSDGLAHAACDVHSTGARGIGHDVWFCWAAPQTACPLGYVVDTCGRTSVDTRIAVYNGCGCPGSDAALLTCRDDECGTQTAAPFQAQPGQSYLIRLGSYPETPGGIGSFTVRYVQPEPCAEPSTNCRTTALTDALLTDRSSFVAADDFALATDSSVTSVCFGGRT